MRKLGWVVVVVVVATIIAGTVLYAQGMGRAPSPGAVGAAPGAGPMGAERTAMMLQMLGLSEAEGAAAQKTIEAKQKARQALQADLGKLRQTADDPAATEKQLTEAIAAYDAALGRYRATVASEDATLAKQLTPRARAKCLAAGVLDNGLGGGAGRMRMGGEGMRGMGGGGGRRGPMPQGAPEGQPAPPQ